MKVFNKINNRTIIGIVCIVLALVITFGAAPLVNRISDRKTDIVRVVNRVERGREITAQDIEVVKVGAYGLPDGVIRDPKAVVGQFATADLFAGDYLSAEKLSRDSAGATDILGTLNGEKVAISVAIGSYSEGLSNKLQNGDIVSIIIYDKDKYMSYIPPELKYVRIITTTTSGGIDRDENTEGEKAVTATVLVTPEQAELLSMYENVTSLHFVLVYRGDKATADAYLKTQDDYLNSHKGQTPAIEENKEDVSEGEQNG